MTKNQEAIDARTPADVKRFWKYVDKKNGPIHTIWGRCWVWTASCNVQTGYGQFGIGGRKGTIVSTHVLSYQIANGPIPPETPVVAHKCDNKRCGRPAHLFLTTQEGNVRDKVQKGRNVVVPHPGETNSSAKLTTKLVLQIARLSGGDQTSYELGEIYGVDACAIQRVWNGKNWGSVTGIVYKPKGRFKKI